MIGAEERALVHKNGLLHPEVFVLIKLLNGKFVFQKRSLSKDTYPGLFTFSVSGHVDLGKTKEEAAICELQEETGINEKIENLKYLGNIILSTTDSKTNTINNSLRYYFGYVFNGKLSDLHIEEEDGAGFAEYSLEELQDMNDEDRSKFVPAIFHPEIVSFFRQI